MNLWVEVASIRADRDGPHFRPVATPRGKGYDGFTTSLLTTRAVEKLLKKYARRIGLDAAVVVHSLRVTALTTARERGADTCPHGWHTGTFSMEEILRRGWENLIGRSDGPMSLRLIIQPAVAIALAIRAGLLDARAGRPPFLWTVLSSPGQRRELMQHGWKDVRTVFIVALILDSIYQVIVHSGIFALELLLTATILALVPYLIARGLVTRVARWAGYGEQPMPPPANDGSNLKRDDP